MNYFHNQEKFFVNLLVQFVGDGFYTFKNCFISVHQQKSDESFIYLILKYFYKLYPSFFLIIKCRHKVFIIQMLSISTTIKKDVDSLLKLLIENIIYY